MPMLADNGLSRPENSRPPDRWRILVYFLQAIAAVATTLGWMSRLL